MTELEKAIKESERAHYLDGFGLGVIIGVIAMIVLIVGVIGLFELTSKI